ncbi:MAG: hypothetical protein KBB55_02655 [Candidatus Buchananbacteria bacterium]|nr:hypothetical protein [Candidatus Buchananbacteria bacterium]
MYFIIYVICVAPILIIAKYIGIIFEGMEGLIEVSGISKLFGGHFDPGSMLNHAIEKWLLLNTGGFLPIPGVLGFIVIIGFYFIVIRHIVTTYRAIKNSDQDGRKLIIKRRITYPIATIVLIIPAVWIVSGVVSIIIGGLIVIFGLLFK